MGKDFNLTLKEYLEMYYGVKIEERPEQNTPEYHEKMRKAMEEYARRQKCAK